MHALRQAAEAHVVRIMEDANLCAIHANRVTVLPKDFALVKRLHMPGLLYEPWSGIHYETKEAKATKNTKENDAIRRSSNKERNSQVINSTQSSSSSLAISEVVTENQGK